MKLIDVIWYYMNMIYRELNSKNKIPSLGFGTWQLKPIKEAYNSVLSAIEDGYRHIDLSLIHI